MECRERVIPRVLQKLSAYALLTVMMWVRVLWTWLVIYRLVFATALLSL